MGKKVAGSLVAGFLGAGIYAAYQKLDEQKKRRLKRNLMRKTDELKDRAVDYAFYASDAVDDIKEILKDEIYDVKQKAATVKDKVTNANTDDDVVDDNVSDEAAKEEEASEVDDIDIVINAEDILDSATDEPQEQPKADSTDTNQE